MQKKHPVYPTSAVSGPSPHTLRRQTHPTTLSRQALRDLVAQMID